MKRFVAGSVSLVLAVSGCSTASKNITADYVTPMQYQSYDCEQLSNEAHRVKNRVVKLGGRLDEAASNDAAITGVGLILFWPALFALGGTKQQEAEYARLSGEYEAIQQASTMKKCGAIINVQDIEPPAPTKQAAVPAVEH